MKKFILALLIGMTVVVGVLAGGTAFVGKRTEIILLINGEAVKSNVYDLKLSAVAKVFLKYGGSYVRYYENEYNGSPNKCLESLNIEITRDIQAFADEERREAKDATASFFNGQFTYCEEEEGRYVDVEKVYFDVINNLNKRTEVSVEILPLKPAVNVEELKRNTVLTAEYFTDFSTSGQNRRHNVALAASKLNNTIVPAGEVLSFNQTVGERTEQNGFKEANIIKDGEFIPGIGGGVCQVSTTLFNCWLQAGLDFESAAAHSLPVSYVRPSLDAMVSSGSDLLLKNNSRYPVFVQAFIKGDKLYFRLFGSPVNYEIRLRSQTLRTLTAEYETEIAGEEITWEEGETERIIKKAVDGLISESYRDFYDGNLLVKTERLRRNTYKPQSGKKVIKRQPPDIGDFNETIGVGNG